MEVSRQSRFVKNRAAATKVYLVFYIFRIFLIFTEMVSSLNVSETDKRARQHSEVFVDFVLSWEYFSKVLNLWKVLVPKFLLWSKGIKETAVCYSASSVEVCGPDFSSLIGQNSSVKSDLWPEPTCSWCCGVSWRPSSGWPPTSSPWPAPCVAPAWPKPQSRRTWCVTGRRTRCTTPRCRLPYCPAGCCVRETRRETTQTLFYFT